VLKEVATVAPLRSKILPSPSPLDLIDNIPFHGSVTVPASGVSGFNPTQSRKPL